MELQDEIREWLTDHLAEILEVAPDEIRADKPIENYGLSSAEGVALFADLEHWLSVPVDSSLIWDYPTINALATYLAREKAAQGS